MMLFFSVLLFSLSTFACNELSLFTTIEPSHNFEPCEITDAELEGYASDSQFTIHSTENQWNTPASTGNDFWSVWRGEQLDDPIITGQISHSYFGLGIWEPEEITEAEVDMSYGEWLANQGLQFSLAFGDPDKEGARVRMDYRWHNQYHGDVLLQLELPF